MENKLFIGSLPWSVSDERLHEVFAAYGDVKEARVATDKFTGKSRGFGFVTYENAEQAKAAIDALDNTDLDGRTIFVSVARPKERK